LTSTVLCTQRYHLSGRMTYHVIETCGAGVAVILVTGLWAGRPAITARGRDFSPPRPDKLWGPTQPPIQWVPGALFPWVKRPGSEAYYSPPSSAKVNAWSYTSISSYVFMALDGGEWSASHHGHFTPRESAPGTHWIGGWVGLRTFLGAVVKRKIPSPRRESNPRTPIVQPVAQRYTDWAIKALCVCVCVNDLLPLLVEHYTTRNSVICTGYLALGLWNRG
jgi:hypothetical protein